MRGHVKKVNGRYYFAIELEPDPVTGKRRQKTISPQKHFNLTKPPNKKETEELLRRYLNELEQGQSQQAANYTVEQWLARWLAESSIKAKTRDSYEYIINTHIIPEIGRISLSKLQPLDLHNLYLRKAKQPLHNGTSGTLSPRTVSYIHQVIKAALNVAVRLDIIPKNPALSINAPSAQADPRDPWTAQEAIAFLEIVKDHQYYPIYHLYLHGGLRKGEALGLRWSDVDFEKMTVKIERSYTQIKGGGTISLRGKTKSSVRLVTIPEETVRVLQSHREVSCFTEPTDYVFATSKGTPILPRNLNRHFDLVLARHGLRKVTIHDLRHTHASLLLAAGENIRVVSDRLGHSTPSITMNIYAHSLPGQQEAAASRIASILSK